MESTGAVSTAVVVPTTELLSTMLQQKPACWTWAAFASVVFQRWAPLEDRKVNQVHGSPVAPVGRLKTGRDVARFVVQHIRDADDVVRDVDTVLGSRAFTAAFGGVEDANTADAEAIVHAGHQLGDLYERLVDLAENCRRYVVPAEYADLVINTTRLLNQLLQDFGDFLDDILQRLEEMQRRASSGQPAIAFEPLRFRTRFDDSIAWSIMDRLQDID